MMKERVNVTCFIADPSAVICSRRTPKNHFSPLSEGWAQKLPIRKCQWWSSYIPRPCLQTYRFLLLLHHTSGQSNLVAEYGEFWAAGDKKNPSAYTLKGEKAGYCLSADRLSFPPWKANVDCYAMCCWMYRAPHLPSWDIRAAEVPFVSMLNLNGSCSMLRITEGECASLLIDLIWGDGPLCVAAAPALR